MLPADVTQSVCPGGRLLVKRELPLMSQLLSHGAMRVHTARPGLVR